LDWFSQYPAVMALKLPGGRFEVDGALQWLRAAGGAGLLLGPGAWAVTGAARWGSRAALHRAEQRWARQARRVLGMELEIRGLADLPQRPCVVASLHEGFADAIALLHLPVPLTFPARDELHHWKVLGRYLERSAQPVMSTSSPVAAYRSLLRGARAAVTRGESVAVFPQGSILGVEVAFRRGAFRLADRLGIPLVPVVITGTHQVWEHPYSPRLRFGCRVEVDVLPFPEIGGSEEAAPRLEQEMRGVALRPGRAPARRFDPLRDGFWDGYDYTIDPAFEGLATLVADHRDEVKARRDA